MDIPTGFKLKVLKSALVSKEGTGQMSIIVQRPYAHLVTELQRIFKGQEEVKLDSRIGERRKMKGPFSNDRRRVDRRRAKETLVEAVISIST